MQAFELLGQIDQMIPGSALLMNLRWPSGAIGRADQAELLPQVVLSPWR
jgi:hypothetical protein